MKIKNIATLLGIILAGGLSVAHAADLMQVYHQAIRHDPTFQQSEAIWQSARENLPLARAGYLPQLAITGSARETYNNLKPSGTNNTNGYGQSYAYSINVTQPIFDAPQWAAIRAASASVKSAFATYNLATQDLIVRTAKAYFAVLQAYDQLRFTVSNKRAVYRQLETARQKFKVGLIAITGVYDARSRYDQAIATEITDRNSLYNRLEDLRAITGQHYFWLQGLRSRVPLIKPKPTNINEWVRIAREQNLSIRAQQYSVLAARDNIDEQASSRLPTIDATASFSQSIGNNDRNSPDTNNRSAFAGLSLNFPILQGGAVGAQTRKARYDYANASARLEFNYRSAVNETRQSYLGIVSGISQIRADIQSIRSAKNALEATEAGFSVGTRTMVDVLDDLSSLYQVQEQYANDQYTYIISIIELKQAAGTLSSNDLEEINRWLNKRIRFHLPKSIYSHPPVPHSGHRSKIIKKSKHPKAISRRLYQSAHLKSPNYKKKSTKKAPRLIAKRHAKLKTAKKAKQLVTKKTHKLVVKQKHATQHKATKKVRRNSVHNEFVIQFYANKGKGHIHNFLTRFPEHQQKLHTLKFADSYKVVMGRYQTVRQAEAVLLRLPEKILAYEPTVIKVSVRNGKLVQPKSQSDYALQLYAADSKRFARDFIAHLPKSMTNLRIVERNHKYKVMAGQYHSIESARQAVSHLPSRIKKLHPWVVSYS